MDHRSNFYPCTLVSVSKRPPPPPAGVISRCRLIRNLTFVALQDSQKSQNNDKEVEIETEYVT